MTDVVTFGETMLRLSPPDFQRLEQATSLNGASAAQAHGLLACPPAERRLVSRLPDNALGRTAARPARWGVDPARRLCPGDRQPVRGVARPPRPALILMASLLHIANPGRRNRLGEDLRRLPSVPCQRDHPRPERRRGRGHRPGRPRGQEGRSARQLRPELPLQALVAGEGPSDPNALHAIRRRPDHHRGRHPARFGIEAEATDKSPARAGRAIQPVGRGYHARGRRSVWRNTWLARLRQGRVHRRRHL
jgi:hypothetical protein